MTPDRFEQLLDAWGADPRRWPEAERAAAQEHLARDPSARALGARAAELDALLDSHHVAPPDAALVRAVLDATGGSSQRCSRPRRSIVFPVRWWWSGMGIAGVAGIGLAGAAAGALAVSMALSAALPILQASAEGAWPATAFESGRSFDWSDE